MRDIITFLLAMALFAAALPGCAVQKVGYYSSPDHGIHGTEFE
jgi:hypothetical protein